MTNEEFQKLVLQKFNSLEEGQNEMKTDIKELNRKMDTVYNQTANLTEFQTGVKNNLTQISNDIKFIEHKEMQTEKELFTIQEKFKVIK